MTTPKQLLLQTAARNNAEWCAAMSRSHDLASEFRAQAWAAPTRTPPYYPDAVTLVPGADPAALTARIDTAVPGASIKDSFADLDLTEAGFQVLFEAQWIHRPASAPTIPSGLAWDVAGDPDMLRAGRSRGTTGTATRISSGPNCWTTWPPSYSPDSPLTAG